MDRRRGRSGAPPDRPDREVTLILADGRTISAIVHRPGLIADESLVSEITGATRLAIDHERLGALRRSHLERLRASRARDRRDGGRRATTPGARPSRRSATAPRDTWTQPPSRSPPNRIRRSGARCRARRGRGRRRGPPSSSCASWRTACFPWSSPRRALPPRSTCCPNNSRASSSTARSSWSACRPGSSRPHTSSWPRACARPPASVIVEATRQDGHLYLDIDSDTPFTGTPDRTGTATEVEDRVGALGGTLTADHQTLHAELPCAS